jgi:hypothetical protein
LIAAVADMSADRSSSELLGGIDDKSESSWRCFFDMVTMAAVDKSEVSRFNCDEIQHF